ANEGQIKNEINVKRKDIDFVLRRPDMLVYVGAGKLEYHFVENGKAQSIKMILQQTNPAAKLFSESKNNYTENYYLGNEIIENVATAQRICYQNIYEGIDWVLYLNKGKFEHEFVLHNSSASVIKWRYEGASKNFINKEGNLVLQNGNAQITEKAPQSFSHLGQLQKSAYQKQQHNYSYAIAQGKSNITIDPAIEWATYQRGADGLTGAYTAASDHLGNIYIAGVTSATVGLASSGAYQTTLEGGLDGFVSKFDTLGHHIWTTYYGGTKGDVITEIQYINGKLYLCGFTYSSSGIATAGTEQSIFGVTPGFGAANAMLIKMDTSGKRIWGTYCGAGKSALFYGIALDSKENIYTVGLTSDATKIATIGAFKDTFARKKLDTLNETDAMLLKYDSSGKKIWGTYIGDTSGDGAQTISLFEDKLYIGGYTRSGRGIATAGTHKAVFSPFDASDFDMFLMRFDTAGNRIWGTYYGGKGGESSPKITCSRKGNIYIYGAVVNGDSALASPGAYQPTALGGLTDLFLAKFDSTGKRFWGTYVSSKFYDDNGNLGGKISVDEVGDDGNVWIMGNTRGSGLGLATTDALKDSLNKSGNRDAFLGSFSPSGGLLYYTYFGGEGHEGACYALYENSAIYLIGSTKSISEIATSGAFITTHSGFEDAAFIAKFNLQKSPVGVANVLQKEEMDLVIFPNPTASSLHLKGNFGTSENKIATIEISNVVGKVVQSEQVNIQNGKLNQQIELFETLQAGLYHLRLVVGEQQIVKSFIKD
ncbi:MAG: T9SS type A sorting domain-containing protein, partial [Chitinophagaceae bacterium]|nr:T9SS type A sorting domain-containing protein [Chitinophagaceae bacterium]